jgi:hypothetical protein
MVLNQKSVFTGYSTEVLVEKYSVKPAEIQKIIVQILKERGYTSIEIQQMLKLQRA